MSSDWHDKTPPEARLKFRVEKVEERLAQGAETFRALRDAIEAIKPKPVQPWVLAAKLVGIATVIVGAAMAIGEYRANSKHTADTVQSVQQDVDRVKADVRAVQKDQAVMQVQLVDVQQTTGRIEAKLDASTDALGRRKRK